MNNLQPYEKHLADRLQELPVPDKETGWKEMRKLLDRDLPEGGAAWSGNRKWWWMGITVAIIISGLWVSQQLSERKAQQANQLPGFRSPEKKISKDDAPFKNVEDVNRNSSTSNISDDIKSVNQKIVDKGNKNEDVDTAQGVVLPFSSASKTESTSTSNRGVQKRNVVNGNTVTEADFNKNEKQHLKGKSDF